MIDYYFWPSPRLTGVSIGLEESGLPYRVVGTRPAQLPVIVDRGADRAPVTVFESGAILLHLAERSGRFLPGDAAAHMAWQCSVSACCPRRDRQARRSVVQQFALLDRSLAERRFLLSEEYTIADMAAFGWVVCHGALMPNGLVHLTRWQSEVARRPAVVRALALGHTPVALGH